LFGLQDGESEEGTMPENSFPIDQSKSMFDQELPGHNRWHPEIPSAES
jgi:formamidase